MKVYAYNISTENLEKTFLTTSVSATGTALTVKNNDRFSDNDWILVGEMGHERSEIVQVNGAVTKGTAITTDALTFDHDNNTPIYKIDYNQVRFYKSTTGSGGSYSVVSTQEIDVDNKDLQTVYDDATGTSASYYKVDFYNSQTTTATSQSDPIAGSGYTTFQIGKVIEDVAREVGDTEFQFISPEEWIAVANECSEDLQSRTKKPYKFLGTSEALSTVLNQRYIDLSTTTETIWKTNLALYNYTNTDGTDRTDPYRVLPFEKFKSRFSDNTADKSDKLKYIAYDEDNNYLLLEPIPATSQTDVFDLRFWKYFTTFTTLSTLIETPTTRVYKLFLKKHYYDAKATQDRAFLAIADRRGNDYESEVARLHRYRIDAGSPRAFTLGKSDVKGYRKY